MDDAGGVTATQRYDPWGTPQGGSGATGFGFAGELQNASSGLLHLRARWYTTGQGRFASVDPFPGMPEQPYSQHPYQYASSNPVRWTDPSGRTTAPIGPLSPGERDCLPWEMRDPSSGQCLPKPAFPPPNNLVPGWGVGDGAQAQPFPGLNPNQESTIAIPRPGFGGIAVPRLPEVKEPGLAIRNGFWTALLLALGCTLASAQVDAQQPNQRPNRIVVELGTGILPDNLIALAARYPDAKIYGIESNAGFAMGARFIINQLGMSNRIEIIDESYSTYSGILRNRADVVVAVEPNSSAPILAGIQNFTRPGGEVLVITEFHFIKDQMVAASGGKALVRRVKPVDAQGVYTGVQVMQSSLGVPLFSQFTVKHEPWEIYIPSW